jgi:hypothetical protein
VQHFESFDQQHVEECFPEATPVLKKRLAKAITRRRQLLLYNEQHYQKSSELLPSQMVMSQNNVPRPEAQRQNIEDLVTSIQDPIERVMEPAPSIFARSAQASTEATKFVPPEETKAVDEQSESGTASSFAFSEGSGERIRVPPRPHGDDGETLDQFLCPFCYHLVEIKTSKAWT